MYICIQREREESIRRGGHFVGASLLGSLATSQFPASLRNAMICMLSCLYRGNRAGFFCENIRESKERGRERKNMRFRIRDSFFENFCTVILLFLSFPEEKGGDETSNVPSKFFFRIPSTRNKNMY